MTAQELFESISEFTSDKQEMLDVLCDGEALSTLGVKDEDIKVVEELYNTLKYSK